MNKQQNKTIGQRVRGLGIAAACAALLAGCGGGGGGGGTSTPDTPPPTLVNVTAVTQGFWAGTLTNGPEASTRASAVIMPDLTTWVAYETGAGVVGVSKLATTGTATGETTANLSSTGNYFSLANGGAATAQSVSGTITSTGAGSGSIAATSTIGSTSTTAALSAQAGYSTAALLSSIANSKFVGNLGGGTVQVTWDFDAAGALKAATSVSSTGCVYTGSLTPVANIAVFTVNVTETCQGTARVLSGIATFKAAAAPAPASIRAIFTANTSPVTGGLLALDKQ